MGEPRSYDFEKKTKRGLEAGQGIGKLCDYIIISKINTF